MHSGQFLIFKNPNLYLYETKMMRDYSPHSSAVPTAFSPEVSASGGHTSPGWETTDPNHQLQSELAASIEKRRLQSVNAGFQSLLSILPQQEGEKMSKVSYFL